MRQSLFTVFRRVRGTAVRKLRTCTGERGNKCTTMELCSANIVAETACYGHGRLELYFRQKELVTDSQPSRLKNCMRVSNNGSEEVCRNLNVMKLKNCTGEYENKFMRQ
jgi:hypothetical protein